MYIFICFYFTCSLTFSSSFLIGTFYCISTEKHDGATKPWDVLSSSEPPSAHRVHLPGCGDGSGGVHPAEASPPEASEEAERRLRQHENRFPGSAGALSEAPGRRRSPGDLRTRLGSGHKPGHQHRPPAAGQQSGSAAAGCQHLHGGARGRLGA